MTQTLEALTLITKLLVQANVATPIIFGVVTGISALIKGITGQPGPSLLEQADMIESVVNKDNDPKIKAEIDRMRVVMGIAA